MTLIRGEKMKQYMVDAFTDKVFSGNTATAFVILNYYDRDTDIVEFNTMSGKLTVTKKCELYEMDFPTYDLQEIPVTDEMEQAFGVRLSKALLAMDLICSEHDDTHMTLYNPDEELL